MFSVDFSLVTTFSSVLETQVFLDVFYVYLTKHVYLYGGGDQENRVRQLPKMTNGGDFTAKTTKSLLR